MAASWRVIVLVVAALVAGLTLGLALISARSDDKGTFATRPTSAPAAATSEADRPTRVQLDSLTVVAQDFNYGEADYAATRDKAQSKLWYHDGSWWATMIDPYTTEVHIFELRDGTWADTGVFVDARTQSNADVFWTGQTLYIASRTSTGELLLQRYSYGDGRAWVPLGGAELISRGGGQSLTIAVDTQDRVWAGWVADGRVWLSFSAPGGTGWTRAINPPNGENVQEDDAVALTDFAGRIGALWSNQEQGAFYWMSRADGSPVEQWDETTTVAKGVNFADGHINFAVSPAGEVFAAVKTSLGDNGEPMNSALIEVLRRDAGGDWTKSTAATVGNQMTRAQLLVTSDGRHLVLVATSPQTGGALYYKIAETSDGKFAPGKGSTALAWEGAVINDPTTTRAPFDPAIPLVILASDSSTGQYYHSELSLASLLLGQQ
jgi:hypothetical protein